MPTKTVGPCRNCGYQWRSRLPPPNQPKSCPRCKVRIDHGSNRLIKEKKGHV